jgi:hypothetical protein
MIVHAYDPSAWKAEAGVSVSSKPAWVRSQTLPQNKTRQNKTKSAQTEKFSILQ